MTNPHEGGSYERQPDGTLKRVEWTRPAAIGGAGVSPAGGEPMRDPFDHDGDGRPGGSLPKSKRKLKEQEARSAAGATGPKENADA